MKRQWTQEQRAVLALQVHNWKPWTRSAGPKSPEGKAKVSRNGWKGGKRPARRSAILQLKAAIAAFNYFEQFLA